MSAGCPADFHSQPRPARFRPVATTVFFFAWLLAVSTAPAQRPADIFSIDGHAASAAVVLAPWAVPDPETLHALPVPSQKSSPMLMEIAGIAAGLSPRAIRDLNRAAAPLTRVPDGTAVAEPLWIIHLTGRTGAQTVRIGQTEHGWLIAETADRRIRLESDAFERVSATWIAPRPDPDIVGVPAPITAGSPELTNPMPRASPIRLDAAALSTRFAKGRQHPFTDPLTRTIADESFTLRLPIAHHPLRPVGLLVWINPTQSGEPPPQILLAADTLGLAIASPKNAGNTRPVVDRLQLALDAAHTAASAVWIDRARVYIAGMSGGGRLASMLWAAAPDVFTGAIGVVGLNSHHQIPTGDKAGSVWPASHTLPRGALGAALRPHPIAAVSGPRDFNFIESRARIRGLAREGFTARLFDLKDIGHTMPNEDQFLAAARWIDRPVQQARTQAADAAAKLFTQIDRDSLADPSAELSRRERRLLERVTIIAPWTEPAWTAAYRLTGSTPEQE